jgi:hypothetical protein
VARLVYVPKLSYYYYCYYYYYYYYDYYQVLLLQHLMNAGARFRSLRQC